MITFEPPSKTSLWPLVRVSGGQAVELTVLSKAPLRLATHWVQRTLLCTETDDCPLCDCCASRPYWYVPVRRTGRSGLALLELSAVGCGDLEQRIRFAGGEDLCGWKVEFSRKSRRSPLRSEVLGHDRDSTALPDHDWISKLMHVFGLRPVGSDEDLDSYSRSVAAAVRQRAKLAAARLTACA